jgi:hypothetical protein
VLLVAALDAPRFLSIQILPVVGLVTSTIAVGPEAQKTEPVGYWATKLTAMRIVNVPDCPPIVIVKLTVPLAEGVPEMVYNNDPAPFAKTPERSVAVRPLTPVELIVCAA